MFNNSTKKARLANNDEFDGINSAENTESLDIAQEDNSPQEDDVMLLPPLLYRSPGINDGQGIEFWQPFYDTFPFIDNLVKQNLTEQNQACLLQWRHSAYRTTSEVTFEWSREGRDNQSFEAVIIKHRQVLESDLEQLLEDQTLEATTQFSL